MEVVEGAKCRCAHRSEYANDHLPTWRGVRGMAPYETTTAVKMPWLIDMACACIVQYSVTAIKYGNVQ